MCLSHIALIDYVNIEGRLDSSVVNPASDQIVNQSNSVFCYLMRLRELYFF